MDQASIEPQAGPEDFIEVETIESVDAADSKLLFGDGASNHWKDKSFSRDNCCNCAS